MKPIIPKRFLWILSLLSLALIIISCGKDSESERSFEVWSVYPHNNSTGVPVDTRIIAWFSRDLDASTVAPNFIVKDSNNNQVSGHVDVIWEFNPVTITYYHNEVEFTPDNNLSHNTKYTVTVTTGVKDHNGNNLEHEFTWSFTTD